MTLDASMSSVVVDMSRAEEVSRWTAVDDRIMGGSSRSRLRHSVEGACCSFDGELVVQGGGFASLRRDAFKLSPKTTALALEGAASDGRLGYKLTLTSRAAPQGVSYQALLPRLGAEPQAVTLPLSSFEPSFRGRPVPDAPKLAAADVNSLGLMLSRYGNDGGVKTDIPPGPFQLKISRILEVVGPED